MERRWRSFWIGVAVVIGVGGLAAPPSQAEEGRGDHIYHEFCASCHGRYGRGDGPLVPDLQRAPRNFVDSSWLAGRTDQQIIHGLTSGHSMMAIANVLKPEALADTIAYIRTLSVPGQNVSLAQGHDIYNALCYSCHGLKGDGKGPAADVTGSTPPRDFTSKKFVIDGREDEIARTISLGAQASFHGSPYMPAWGSRLSKDQIRDVIAYLKTFKKKKM